MHPSFVAATNYFALFVEQKESEASAMDPYWLRPSVRCEMLRSSTCQHFALAFPWPIFSVGPWVRHFPSTSGHADTGLHPWSGRVPTPVGIAGEAFFVLFRRNWVGWLCWCPFFLTKCVAKAAHGNHDVCKVFGLAVLGISPHRIRRICCSQQMSDNREFKPFLELLQRLLFLNLLEEYAR